MSSRDPPGENVERAKAECVGSKECVGLELPLLTPLSYLDMDSLR